jgi:hypothetical protein
VAAVVPVALPGHLHLTMDAPEFPLLLTEKLVEMPGVSRVIVQSHGEGHRLIVQVDDDGTYELVVVPCP